MIRAFALSGPETSVLDVMDRDVPTINCHAPLGQAVTTLQSSGYRLISVIDDTERVVEIITLENLAEYMMVTHARRSWRQPKIVGPR